MAYRQIDIRGIFRGNARALDTLHKAWGIDCSGQDDIFLRVYGWQQSSLDRALSMAGDTSRDEK